MLLKNIAAQGIYLYAYTIATGAAKTGDAANITGYSSIEGATTGTVFGTAHPTEISAANLPGVYWQPLAQAETNGNCIAYCWKSATAGVAIDPVLILTTGVSIPAVAPGAANGVFIAGTNAATVVTTSFTTTFTGNLTGSVASVAAPVSIDKTQTLSAPRNVSAVADTALTLNDAMHCAIAGAAGRETVVSTTYTVMTAAGTTLRVFTLDSGSAPTSRT